MISYKNIKYCNNIISNILKINYVSLGQNTFLKNFSYNIATEKRTILNKYWISASSFHTSAQLRDISGLNEFFDDSKNWGEQEVKVGRSWKMEELRLKSNEDLHKLWYVLLKEKNMLLTMEYASKEEYRLFPNPERIDKVEESMKNLETVVKERDNAYMLLETGESGERPVGFVMDSFGRKAFRKYKEYLVPDYMHTRVMNNPFSRYPVKTQFCRLLREKSIRLRWNKENREFRHVCKILKLYPDVDFDALKQKYPKVDVDRARRSSHAKGNHNNNIA